MHEDGELMESFKAGSHECFEKLIMKYRIQAICFARRYVKDAFLAEDLVQESFADLFVHGDRYKSGYSFKTYLYSIIKNKCISSIRKQSKICLEECKFPSDVADPEAVVVSREAGGMVRRLIKELKDEYRTAIYLIDYEGFSYEEASRIMGKNLGQIKILVFRARKKLKTLLEKEGMDSGNF